MIGMIVIKIGETRLILMMVISIKENQISDCGNDCNTMLITKILMRRTRSLINVIRIIGILITMIAITMI